MAHRDDRQREPVRLTVAGSFGFGNAGDEGAPLAIEDLGRSIGVELSVDVLGRFTTPADSDVIGLGEEDAVRRASIAQQPVLLVGGGIVEPLAKASVTRIGAWIREAGVPYSTLFAAAVEPHCKYNWAARRRLNRDLKSARHLFVRDELSARTLRALQPKRDVEVIGDVVLCLEPAELLPEPVRALDRYIAVNLAPRWSENQAWRPWIAEQIAAVAGHLNAAVVFVPCTQQHDRDQVEHDAVADLLQQRRFGQPIVRLSDGYGPREIAAAFGGAELVVAMRLHAAVLAYARQVPWVALAYHPKLSGFAATVDQRDRLLPPQLPNEQSAEAYGYTFSALNLADCELKGPALSAMDGASFHKLAELRTRLAEALRAVLSEASGAPSQQVVEARR